MIGNAEVDLNQFRQFIMMSGLAKGIARFLQLRFHKNKLHDTQYLSEKNMAKEEVVDIQQGAIEAKFSETDENGLIVKEKGWEDEFNAPEIVAEEVEHDGKDYAFFDCPDLNCAFSVKGVRNGDIFVHSKNSIGATTKLVIPKVFTASGKPRVTGIVVRRMQTNSDGQINLTNLGYIDLTKYIGINATSILSLEDIISEGVEAVSTGQAPIPQDILNEITDQ